MGLPPDFYINKRFVDQAAQQASPSLLAERQNANQKRWELEKSSDKANANADR